MRPCRSIGCSFHPVSIGFNRSSCKHGCRQVQILEGMFIALQRPRGNLCSCGRCFCSFCSPVCVWWRLRLDAMADRRTIFIKLPFSIWKTTGLKTTSQLCFHNSGLIAAGTARNILHIIIILLSWLFLSMKTLSHMLKKSEGKIKSSSSDPSKFPPIVRKTVSFGDAIMGYYVCRDTPFPVRSTRYESQQVKAFILAEVKLSLKSSLCNADLVTEETIVLETVKFKGHKRPAGEIAMSSQIASSFLLS